MSCKNDTFGYKCLEKCVCNQSQRYVYISKPDILQRTSSKLKSIVADC